MFDSPQNAAIIIKLDLTRTEYVIRKTVSERVFMTKKDDSVKTEYNYYITEYNYWTM